LPDHDTAIIEPNLISTYKDQDISAAMNEVPLMGRSVDIPRSMTIFLATRGITTNLCGMGAWLTDDRQNLQVRLMPTRLLGIR
jgi:hypothetical protein